MTVARPTDRRRALGTLGEQLAEQHLVRRGYRILSRNWRCRAGELDLVVCDDRALVFCEVKARVRGGCSGPGTALEAVGPAKRRRVRSLARAWMVAQPPPRRWPADIRFDAIGVTVDATGRLLSLEHVEDAF